MDRSLLYSLSDSQLFQLVKDKGDSCAFAELYNRYFKILWRFALRHQTDPDEAQDSLQDVFTYLWEKRDRIVIKTNVASYLYRATLNQILKKVNRDKFIAAYEEVLAKELVDHHSPIEETIYEKEAYQNLTVGITYLPEKMRLVFEASRFEGLSHEEIGQRFNISKETVKSQIKNALKILKKYLPLLMIIFF